MALSCFWNFKWAIKTIKKSNCFRLESILASYLWFKRKDKGQKFIPKFCVLNSVWLAMISQILELARTNKYYAGKEIRKFYELLCLFLYSRIFFLLGGWTRSKIYVQLFSSHFRVCILSGNVIVCLTSAEGILSLIRPLVEWKRKKNFMAHFYGLGSTASKL